MKFVSSFLFCFLMLAAIPSVAFADQMIYEHQTSFAYRGESAPRAHNIRVAADRIDGVIIQPGQEFSYNEIVGPRTFRNGFRRAPVILHGRLSEDFGGGVCQVAGTIHAAALMTGMRIVEEHAHSRLSSYLSPGMDTTVVYPIRDFRFINILSRPLRIRAFENAPGSLTIQFWSDGVPPAVSISLIEIERRPFRSTHIVRCDNILPGRRDVVERGTPYLRVVRQRFIDGVAEEVEVEYPSSQRIVHFCPRQ